MVQTEAGAASAFAGQRDRGAEGDAPAITDGLDSCDAAGSGRRRCRCAHPKWVSVRLLVRGWLAGAAVSTARCTTDSPIVGEPLPWRKAHALAAKGGFADDSDAEKAVDRCGLSG